jgi:hypothetical protein
MGREMYWTIGLELLRVILEWIKNREAREGIKTAARAAGKERRRYKEPPWAGAGMATRPGAAPSSVRCCRYGTRHDRNLRCAHGVHRR